MCVSCGHTLQLVDLIPVFSWLSTRGKCRYCQKTISWQYPTVELATAVLFVVSYLFWPEPIDGWGIIIFGIWLAALVGLVALIVYDLRWMLLPNKIIGPLVVLATLSLMVEAIFISPSVEVFISGLAGALVGGGVFYVIFQVSKGRWIGGGDVKLGFLLGLLVGEPGLAFLVLFIASLLGTILIVPLVAIKHVPAKARIPFGPFLIMAAVLSRLFGQDIIDGYLKIAGL